jgi:polyphosphate glucokinase
VEVLGIEIGGQASKAAPVDLERGTLLADRWRRPTPPSATPEGLAELVRDAVEHFGWTGAVGCTFPGRVRGGVVLDAVRLDDRWPGTDVDGLFGRRAGTRVRVTDAPDAVGLAERRFGAARHAHGVVVVLTFDEGLGSALFVDSHLVPGTRLGQIELRGRPAFRRAGGRVRADKDLTWRQWAERIDEYLRALDDLLAPDLVVLGGSIAKQADRLVPRLQARAPVVPGLLLGAAGMVGAAIAAARDDGDIRGTGPLPIIRPAAVELHDDHLEAIRDDGDELDDGLRDQFRDDRYDGPAVLG